MSNILVEDRGDYYFIQLSYGENDDACYMQRKYIKLATDSPLSLLEDIIIRLCEKITNE